MPNTLFQPGQNTCAAAQADRVAMMVDGEEYFAAFVEFASRAQRHILILAWDFDSRMTLRYNEDGTPRETLGEFLNGLCEKNPKLRIDILDWDFPMVYGTDREYSPIFGLDWKPHRHIKLRFDDTHPLAGSHHQKVVVFDGKVAFAGGLDLTNCRWDTCEHAKGDKRRTFGEKEYPPFHDVMIAVDGQAARELADLGRRRWRAATGRRLKGVEVAGDPWPPQQRVDIENVRVGIACTHPISKLHPEGVHHIESLYLDMIRSARDYIYIENQYFTSEKVGAALEARLKEKGGPEIVVVTRLLSHGWLEEVTMHVLRTRLVRQLRAADTEGRFHAYYPHVDGLCEGTCVDLHSKVMIVDDEWLRIGSSNLSNRSMGVDTECDVVVEAQGDKRVRDTIRAFRNKLVAEHAGCDEKELAAALEKAPSLAAAVATLGSPARQLRELETPEVSEALMAAAKIGDMEKPISFDALVQGFAHDEPHPPKKRRFPVALVSSILVLLGFAAAWRWTPLADVVTADTVVAFTQSFARNWWAPLVIILAYTPACMVMFPRPLITLAAVMAFGPWEGLTYSMTGVVLAGVVGYGIGRLFHRDTARRLAGPKLARVTNLVKKRGIVAVALVRFVPIAPYLVVNAVMGAMRIKLSDFVIGTFIGMLPGAMAATVLSDQFAAALRDPSHVNGWLVAAAIGTFAALAYFGQRILRRMESPSSFA